MAQVYKYDEEMFTTILDVINKIEIEEIHIDTLYCYNEKIKNFCIKVQNKLENVQTQNMFCNKVSFYFII